MERQQLEHQACDRRCFQEKGVAAQQQQQQLETDETDETNAAP